MLNEELLAEARRKAEAKVSVTEQDAAAKWYEKKFLEIKSKEEAILASELYQAQLRKDIERLNDVINVGPNPEDLWSFDTKKLIGSHLQIGARDFTDAVTASVASYKDLDDE